MNTPKSYQIRGSPNRQQKVLPQANNKTSTPKSVVKVSSSPTIKADPLTSIQARLPRNLPRPPHASTSKGDAFKMKASDLSVVKEEHEPSQGMRASQDYEGPKNPEKK
jgi:hypothetical protein